MLYSFDVTFEGKSICRLGDLWFHNKKNIMGLIKGAPAPVLKSGSTAILMKQAIATQVCSKQEIPGN